MAYLKGYEHFPSHLTHSVGSSPPSLLFHPQGLPALLMWLAGCRGSSGSQLQGHLLREAMPDPLTSVSFIVDRPFPPEHFLEATLICSDAPVPRLPLDSRIPSTQPRAWLRGSPQGSNGGAGTQPAALTCSPLFVRCRRGGG